ncbi:uncharacterized protein LOC131150810 isoform X2 [Malania oleifera]|uniref:uncharacterized protein LOC131150810 isoform X2 n=1 Tax=Malania oleifera TaxID=397392 RepID=UPI0025AEC7AA|nr:uncharacterized protein LOC131150810 isoform X2 [Malania oleifera]
MKTRTAGTPKSAAAKKTPPARKTAGDATPNPTEAASGSATPKSAEKKPEPASATATKAKQVKSSTDATPGASTDSKPEPPVEGPKESGGAGAGAQVTPGAKTPGAKVNSGSKKTVVKKVVRRVKTPSSAKAAAAQTYKSGEAVKQKVEESPNAVNAVPAQTPKSGEVVKLKVEESPDTAKAVATQTPKSGKVVKHMVEVSQDTAKGAPTQTPKSGEIVKQKVEESVPSEMPESRDVVRLKAEESLKDLGPIEKQERPVNAGQSTNMGQTTVKVEEAAAMDGGESGQLEEPVGNFGKSPVIEGHNIAEEEKVAMEEDTEEETKTAEDKEEHKIEPANMEEDAEKDLKPEDENGADGVDYGEQEVLEEPGEEPAEDGEGEPGDEAEPLEEECMELTAHAKERKIKKELEIFVGGLDRDAKEEDVKKAFEKVGEVVEVRLHRNLSSNKNKGYAFVKFSNKEQASRALSEMKNPMICGKRCGTAPSEDNDTLFLGNICNTWTKEAIKQKLKDYGIEGVVNITLVPDARHEGLSRGFAFLEFSCHVDAMLAYKRLQKPDAVFGHAERTAKVAFAEPLRDPDPEIMAQVKSVFVDGLPPHWDEDRVREQFKGYGEIEKIVLARNMSTAKRKDFGFVDFSTHEAAIACIDGINSIELVDGNSKIKVRARLSNPLPKTQAVKGGMCGGFRIGRGAGTSQQHGRGFGRGAHLSSRANYQRGRGFHPYGRGQIGRMGFLNEHDFDNPYAEFHGRQFFGRGGRRGVAAPSRLNLGRPSHDAADGVHGKPFSSRRQPFSPEGAFGRPFVEPRFDDPYFYDDNAHGMKRPFYMTDPSYVEPSRLRPRLDYSDPAVSFRETHYPDTFGAGGGPYSRDYYGSEYGGGAYPSFYGAERSYRGGYY